MCCFSRPVISVADTRIFARGSGRNQYLVYTMKYASSQALAMVLPLPIPPGTHESEVRFINLEGYRGFFESLQTGFPSRKVSQLQFLCASRRLTVHDVGDFEASFVPTIDDFDRLDPRFRIPRATWNKIPTYADYGFAVFKLKKTRSALWTKLSSTLIDHSSRTGDDVHPMALEFPRRNPDLLFFPTIHIHDGKVHPTEWFDHELYCQADPAIEEELHLDEGPSGWQQSKWPAHRFVMTARTAEIVQPDLPIWRRIVEGRLPNRDSLVGRGGSLPTYDPQPAPPAR
ncbi:MAG: hypothetical protein ACK50P_03690 [Planctomycetaceae bacterium]|jgi:hypothetical protein